MEKEDETDKPKPDARKGIALLRMLRFKHQMDSEPKEERVGRILENVKQRVEQKGKTEGVEKWAKEVEQGTEKDDSDQINR